MSGEAAATAGARNRATAGAIPGAHRIPPLVFYLAIPVILALQALTLHAMGRLTICSCGYVKLWHGVVQSSENSQHIFDWYSLTHVIHGFALYLLFWLLLRRSPLALRLMLAVIVEVGWEFLENSDFVITRYRADTISLDYFGDSIVNSLGDVVSMMFGFLVASRLPTWNAVAIAVTIELTLLYIIHDNLALNVIMLVHPIDAIKAWQASMMH
jgi:uncharacterized protein DUF2585